MSPIGTAAGVYTSACLPKYNARVFVDEGSRDRCSRDSHVSELRPNEPNQVPIVYQDTDGEAEQRNAELCQGWIVAENTAAKERTL